KWDGGEFEVELREVDKIEVGCGLAKVGENFHCDGNMGGIPHHTYFTIDIVTHSVLLCVPITLKNLSKDW
ncbi:hypothetical protein DVH24_005784, partial [Malus domestica]